MHIIRSWLAVGKYSETISRPILDTYNITAMLQLSGEAKQPNIETHFMFVEDGEALPHDKIREGITFIREQKAQGKNVLVACGAGVSRSVTFTMMALMEEEGLELFDAYREVFQHHPEALPHPELIRSVLAYYGQDDMDMLDIYMMLQDVRDEG